MTDKRHPEPVPVHTPVAKPPKFTEQRVAERRAPPKK
jgi:hypothetical protein